MNKRKYYINLYILIPLIYSGISIIGVILTCQLIGTSAKGNPITTIRYFELMILIGLLTYFISFLIIRNILKPMEKFVKKTQKMSILKELSTEEANKIIADEKQIEKVLDNVANILSSIEAKELFPDIIGASSSMRNIFTQITKVASTDSTVLISGESGTGKELIAQSIYEHSARKGKAFVKINCVAIPEGLIESELFGHEKGSFTGATGQKKGKFEIANGGTIFLDEIGDMPLNTQSKLLRVLQEKEFERVGGNIPIHVDVRFIAATNKDLPKMIKEGFFREDLYYRINVFSIYLPALRERLEDIPVLANYFLGNFTKKVSLSKEVLKHFIGYLWPGNIRELKNVLEQASVLAEKEIIEPQHLPEVIKWKRSSDVLLTDTDRNITLDGRLIIMEKEMIISALKMSGGVQVKAGNVLGINQRSLWHRIKKLNIDIDRVKYLQ